LESINPGSTLVDLADRRELSSAQYLQRKIVQKNEAKMHIEWERQIKRTEIGRTQYQLVALLVESRFSGKNENVRLVARLGAIQERFLLARISRTRAFHQGLFWVKLDRQFENLGLTGEQKKTLEVQISEKIPRPAEDWALWGVTCIPRVDC